MSDQRDLFDESTAAASVAEAGTTAPAADAASSPPAVANEGGKAVATGGAGGGGLPPHFAPMAPEFDDALPIGRYASLQYLQYAIATVKDRALPRVGDGQKPVQARILYAMWEMGGRAGTPRKKSARVVGDVLGKFHPHGDASVYDALVRLAQDFTLRYPLIDGEGNFGSRDGDEPAAMRYTEARLTKFSEVLLSELDQGTVEFIANYDGSTQEPAVLPARLPMLLLNGASGIAVGMATEIPSHNLVEVAQAAIAVIRNPQLDVRGIMEHIQGPDFPGGAQIITPRSEIQAAYEAGRGSVRVRARWTIERLARGQWQMVVTELPPGTSARKVLEEIDALTSPQPKAGKKSISAEQQREKQLMLSMLDKARDESDRSHPVRLVLEPKTSRVDETEFVNLLLAKTSMETNASINLVMVGLDGRPTGKSLRDVLAEWTAFRLETVRRRSQHRLDQVLDRIHVLEGRMIVLLNVDEVIRVIRNADDPKAELMAAFGLTERQAEDILEMRLRQLAKLEHIKIEKELEGLRKEQKDLDRVLGSRKELEKLVIREIEADIKAFGDVRRTVIEASEKAAIAAAVIDEPVTVIFSRNGWVRARQGWEVDPAALSFKEGDALGTIVKCRTVDPVVFLDSRGRAYTVAIADLPSGRGDGVPASSLVEVQDGAKIQFCLAGRAETQILVASSGGYAFHTRLADMISNRRAGREFMTLERDEAPLVPVPFEDRPGTYVAAVADNGKLLLVQLAELKYQARGRGLILMGLDKKERLVAVAVSDQPRLTVLGEGRGGKPKEIDLKPKDLGHYAGSRTHRGRVLPEKIRPTGLRTVPG
ncbi:MAG: DNA topoisomerase IV subunit A [Betaproteobacteria bacterium]|nr:DNA topoisomerase IV subunit A [Betaproteobacteria bacterium]